MKDLYNRDPEKIVLFSTVSAAIKKDIWERNKFNNNIIMSEDQDFAIRILKQGCKIAYQANSVVIHGHNYTLRQVLIRYFYSGRSFKQIRRIHSLCKYRSFNYIGSSKYILMHSDMKRLTSLLYAIIYNFVKILGFLLGLKTP